MDEIVNEVMETANEVISETPVNTKVVTQQKLSCPHCGGEIIIEKTVNKRTSSSVGTRGSLHGIAVKDMTLEQLKREQINAKSVLYKATQRNADPALIAANQIRVDTVVAEIAMRAPAIPVAKDVTIVAGVPNPVKAYEEETPAEY